MGLIGGIVDAVKESPVGDAVKKVADVAKDVPSPVRVAKAGADLVQRNLPEPIRDAGRAAIETAKAGVRRIGESPIARSVAKAATSAGKWAWDHKAEIGMWVGSAALLAAVPVTGGASGALAGGLMAGRIGMLAARVPGAVRAVQAGSAMLRASGGAQRVLSTVRAGGSAVHAGRAALGATRGGRALAATAKPLGKVSMAVSGANVVDQTAKLARGDEGGSFKNLALNAVGLVPGFAALRGSAAKAGVAQHEVQAVRTVASGLPGVRQKAATALQATDDIAARAPGAVQPARAQADQTLAAASSAERAAAERLAVGGAAGAPDESVAVIGQLKSQVDDAAAAAAAARERAAAVVPVAPRPASVAAGELDDAAAQASRVSRQLEEHLEATASLARTADVAARVERAVGNASQGVNIANNANTIARDAAQGNITATNLSLGLLSVLLKRNKSLRADDLAAA